MKIRKLMILVVAVLCFVCSALAEELSVLPQPKPGARVTFLRDAIRPKIHEALDRRLNIRAALETPEQIETYQKKLKSGFIRSLGGFPERTPLKAHIVGTIDEDDYRIEKIIYQSRPNFFVTANLYLPRTEAPYPAVLVPCGHSASGKAYDAYQKICILLAKHGVAAFCYDPPGQGERHQILEHDGGQIIAPFKPTAEHNVTGVAPVLLGENLATYFIWDGIRGLDYLQSREDIDGDRLGCTGNSGGGMMTSYLMALDERIKAAAPGCFITTTRIKNERPGPGDAEQNIFAQTAYGLDHADFIMLTAPRPVLIAAATHDFVPIEGTWNSYRQAKRLYTKLGVSERVSLVEANEKHGFTKPLRIAVTHWMQRWLLGVDEPVEEPELVVHTEQDLRCTPAGEVLLLKDAKSLHDLFLERENSLSTTRRKQRLSRIDFIRKLKSLTKVNVFMDNHPIDAVSEGVRSLEGYQIEKVILKNALGIPLPMLFFRPTQPTTSAVLYVHGDGKQVACDEQDFQKYLKAGRAVLAVDLSGYGETESTPWRFSETYSGPNAAAWYNLYMLGSSLVAIRTSDLLIASRFCARRCLRCHTSNLLQCKLRRSPLYTQRSSLRLLLNM